jgi:hypothetical protein
MAMGGELDEIARLLLLELAGSTTPSFTAAALTRCSKSMALKLNR